MPPNSSGVAVVTEENSTEIGEGSSGSANGTSSKD